MQLANGSNIVTVLNQYGGNVELCKLHLLLVADALRHLQLAVGIDVSRIEHKLLVHKEELPGKVQSVGIVGCSAQLLLSLGNALLVLAVVHVAAVYHAVEVGKGWSPVAWGGRTCRYGCRKGNA